MRSASHHHPRHGQIGPGSFVPPDKRQRALAVQSLSEERDAGRWARRTRGETLSGNSLAVFAPNPHGMVLPDTDAIVAIIRGGPATARTPCPSGSPDERRTTMKRHRIRTATTLAAIATLLGGLAGPAAAQSKPKVAFIYVGPVGDAGWTFQHDQARSYLEQNLGVETKFV